MEKEVICPGCGAKSYPHLGGPYCSCAEDAQDIMYEMEREEREEEECYT